MVYFCRIILLLLIIIVIGVGKEDFDKNVQWKYNFYYVN